ncbi:MAG TPA: hypothetical protein VGJ79_10700 [Candidatus Dormibacteraeota bacterium]|jgi:regulator of RNase E activity RraA
MTANPLDQASARELCDALREFDAATLSNAIESFDVRDRTIGFASKEVACCYPELGSMVGFAVTCTVDTTTPGPRRPTRLSDLIALVEAAPKPAIVVCQYVGKDPSRGCFAGDMVVTLLQRLGAVGIVTDAPNRDVQMIQQRAPGFHLFGSGKVASHGNGAIEGVNLTVDIGGLVVRPGDLLHGDVNGLISIPLEIAAELPGRARQVLAEEQQLVDLMRDPAADIALIKARFLH